MSAASPFTAAVVAAMPVAVSSEQTMAAKRSAMPSGFTPWYFRASATTGSIAAMSWLMERKSVLLNRGRGLVGGSAFGRSTTFLTLCILRDSFPRGVGI